MHYWAFHSYFEMGILKSPMPVCPAEKRCLRWVQVYLKDCVCSVRDEISFSFGLISVLSWGIAEVPQIMTNYKEKSTEGLSLTFLMTWILGDLFNLFGCWLEPATLPTQFYMAVLYTATTLVLVWQTLYYGYLYKRMGANITNLRLWLEMKIKNFHKEGPKEDSSKEYKSEPPNLTHNLNCSSKVSERNGPKNRVPEESTGLIKGTTVSSPISVLSSQVAHRRSVRRDLYYMSARSLAQSHTPTAGSYTAQSLGSWPRRNIGLITDQEIADRKDLLTSLVTNTSAPTNSKSLFCAVGTIFLLGAVNLHVPLFKTDSTAFSEMKGIVLPIGRKLLQEANYSNLSSVQQGEASAMLGTYMGWMMAAIYMGGRLPQIYLNMKRGTAEGLNPLMFMFAIIGNGTYVGSILIRSTDWAKLRPNMPWLVDAAVCVLLDCFIIAQFIYFHLRKTTEREDSDGDYEAAK